MKNPLLFGLLALSLLAPAVRADDAAPLPEAKPGSFDYPNVAAARKALLARRDAKSYTDPNGWLIVQIESKYTTWSFAPRSDPSYPAVVKRVIAQDPSKYIYIDMSVLCEASKEACDNLVKGFQALNKQIEASLNHR